MGSEHQNAGISRRGLLTTASAVAAGVSVSRSLLGRAKVPRLDDVHVAILGVGVQGSRLLLSNLHRMKGLRFKAVCDISPYNRVRHYRILKRYGHDVRQFEDYRQMLAEVKDLDAAIIATPDWVHAEQSIACMKAGLCVYCEKEMSNDLEQARQMVLTARRTGKLLQIGHQRRSNLRYLRALEYIHAQRALGRITHVKGQWNRHQALHHAADKKKVAQLDTATLKRYGYDTMERFRNWRWYRKFSGGPIADLGSHQVDVFNWVLGGVPRALQATGGNDYYPNTEWYDNASVLYEWECNWQGRRCVVRGVYQVLNTTSHGGYFETFLGDEGSLKISENTRVRSGIRREDRAPRAPWERWKEMRAAMIAAGMKPLDEDDPDAKSKKDDTPKVKPSPDNGRLFPIPMPEEWAALPVHLCHLANFFAAVRDPGKVPLTCPGEVGFETAMSVLPVNEALRTGARIPLKPEQFTA